MRASVCVLGPLLGREREGHGLDAGWLRHRGSPIDLHLKGFEALAPPSAWWAAT